MWDAFEQEYFVSVFWGRQWSNKFKEAWFIMIVLRFIIFANFITSGFLFLKQKLFKQKLRETRLQKHFS